MFVSNLRFDFGLVLKLYSTISNVLQISVIYHIFIISFQSNLFTSSPVHLISCTDPPFRRTVLDILLIELVTRADQDKSSAVLYQLKIAKQNAISLVNKTMVFTRIKQTKMGWNNDNSFDSPQTYTLFTGTVSRPSYLVHWCTSLHCISLIKVFSLIFPFVFFSLIIVYKGILKIKHICFHNIKLYIRENYI